MRSGVRYLAVVVTGFAADLGLALALNRLAGLDLTLAAAGGFVGALLLNYLMFELWVFRADRAALSARRLAATAGSAVIALAVRLAAVAGLGALIQPEGAVVTAGVLIIAAGLSLIVNWALVSRIFARSGEREPA
jgi:putative flippase GtrA